jgi:NAD(P)-dependent dehydrogenase (short-subunit alcohol dehydrogenase family)
MGVAYFASKHGIIGLTRTTALNMMTKRLSFGTKLHGIITIVIHLGGVKTDMGGLGAKITMEESVSRMLHVIDNLTKKDNGKFLGWDGKEVPW